MKLKNLLKKLEQRNFMKSLLDFYKRHFFVKKSGTLYVVMSCHVKDWIHSLLNKRKVSYS